MMKLLEKYYNILYYWISIPKWNNKYMKCVLSKMDKRFFRRVMKTLVPFILNIICCAAYCVCLNHINACRPIAYMDVSIGILFRFSIVVLFLTLLAGMFILRLTRRKLLIALPVIMPVLMWVNHLDIFPRRAFVYMGLSIVIYGLYLSICSHLSNRT